MSACRTPTERPRGAARWSHGLLGVLRSAALLLSSTRVIVEGDSMAPALVDGDRLLVSRLAVRLGSPRRGDIVLLRDPSRPGSECIKRIVALPGERVRLEGLAPVVERDTNGTDGRKLGRGEYFVAGDNLAHSTDSRAYGPVGRRALLGRAWYRYASRSEAKGSL